MLKPEFTDWCPPPDTERPELPYKKGLRLRIRHHRPPAPFGIGCPSPAPRKELSAKAICDLYCTQSRYCLRNPPMGPVQHASPEVQTTLEIVSEIECEDGRGAQIVVCHRERYTGYLVAKVYDPLYYSYRDKTKGSPVDVTYAADMHYSREAAAYELLQSQGVDGLYAPAYHGSFTFETALSETSSETRSVRLILMEWIEGGDMRSFAENREVPLTSEQRLELLGQAIELDTTLRFHGVIQGNFSPRHVVSLVDGNGKLEDQNVTSRRMIDFSCFVSGIPYSKSKDKKGVEFFRNPFEMYGAATRQRPGTYLPYQFGAWFPKEWASDPRLFRSWVATRWKGRELPSIAKARKIVGKERAEGKVSTSVSDSAPGSAAASLSTSDVKPLASSIATPITASTATSTPFTAKYTVIRMATPVAPSTAPSLAPSTAPSIAPATRTATPTAASTTTPTPTPTTTSAFTSTTQSTAPSAAAASPTPTLTPRAITSAPFTLTGADFTDFVSHYRTMTADELLEADHQLSLENATMQLRSSALRQAAETYDRASQHALTQRLVATVVSSFTGEQTFDSHFAHFSSLPKEALGEARGWISQQNAVLQMRIAALSAVQAERIFSALPTVSQMRLAEFRKGVGLRDGEGAFKRRRV